MIIPFPSALLTIPSFEYSDDSALLFRRKAPCYSEGFRHPIPIDCACVFRANRSVATRVLQLLLVFVVGLPVGCQVAFLFRMDSPLSVMV